MDRLTFEKPDDVGKWLEDKPADWAQVVAMRVALRVFPLVLNTVQLPDEVFTERRKQGLILASFRAGFISWAARTYPAQEMQDAAAATANAADNANATATAANAATATAYATAYAIAASAANAANAATAAVATAAHTASAAATAASAAANAANAASSFAGATYAAEPGRATLLASLSEDCQRLFGGAKPEDLIHQQLWPEELRNEEKFQANQPVWAFLAFDNFVNSGWIKTSAGSVIADSYRHLVPFEGNASRSAFGKEADIAIATQPDAFWTSTNERDFDVIWRDIETLSRSEKISAIPASDSEAGGTGQGTEETEKGGFGTDGFGDGPFGGTPDDPKDDKEPPAEINVAVQFDQYARKDELGRKRFAEILAARIGELHVGGGRDGLAVNLHAPWGAGKTTVLYFMKGFLEAEELPEDRRWVVIDFNAWQHEHRRPPWWPFLETVKSQLSDRLTAQKRRTRAAEVRHAWNEWKFKAEAFPIFLVLLVVAILLTLFLSGSSDVFKTVLGAVGGVFTLLATVSLYSRKAFFGSEKSASLYHDFASDPLEKLSILFRDMIEAADAPVCIFIDDLDRCQNDFVVEFLEGLQTSFRHRKVAYVVAADKFWIKTSFEDKYASFCEKTADRTQPLGYQFLEKIFQFNVPLPGMAAWKKRYLEARLGLTGTGSGGTGDGGAERFRKGLGGGAGAGIESGTGRGDGRSPEEAAEDQEVERLRGEIRSTQPEGLTHETVRMLSTGDGSVNPAFQAALALEYTTSATALREAEHFLLQYLELLPDNPRVIKRIINAFGMSVATAILEQQALDYDVLTRWTILEQCYPAVADELTGDPSLVDQLLAVDADGGEDLSNLTDTLVAFCAKNMAVKLLKSGDDAVLTRKVIRRLTRGFDEQDAEEA